MGRGAGAPLLEERPNHTKQFRHYKFNLGPVSISLECGGSRVPQVTVLYLGLRLLFSYLCALCVPTSVIGACPDPVGVLPSLFLSLQLPRNPSLLPLHSSTLSPFKLFTFPPRLTNLP